MGVCLQCGPHECLYMFFKLHALSPNHMAMLESQIRQRLIPDLLYDMKLITSRTETLIGLCSMPWSSWASVLVERYNPITYLISSMINRHQFHSSLWYLLKFQPKCFVPKNVNLSLLLKRKKNVTQMLFLPSVALGVYRCLCLIESSWKVGPQQGNDSKQGAT